MVFWNRNLVDILRFYNYYDTVLWWHSFRGENSYCSAEIGPLLRFLNLNLASQTIIISFICYFFYNSAFRTTQIAKYYLQPNL